MRKSLFALALAPLLGGCLGPAPWADWDKGYDAVPDQPEIAASRSDWDTAASTGAMTADSSLTPPEGVTYGARPEVDMLAAEPITAPPSTTASVGGPFVPLEAAPSDEAPAQPLKLQGSGALRTLPLLMTGTGEKLP